MQCYVDLWYQLGILSRINESHGTGRKIMTELASLRTFRIHTCLFPTEILILYVELNYFEIFTDLS
jgi:hypothetical protein